MHEINFPNMLAVNVSLMIFIILTIPTNDGTSNDNNLSNLIVVLLSCHTMLKHVTNASESWEV